MDAGDARRTGPDSARGLVQGRFLQGDALSGIVASGTISATLPTSHVVRMVDTGKVAMGKLDYRQLGRARGGIFASAEERMLW